MFQASPYPRRNRFLPFPLPLSLSLSFSLSTLSLSDIYRRCDRFWCALSAILEAFSGKRDGLFVFSLYAETDRAGARCDWKFWILKQGLHQLREAILRVSSFAGTFAGTLAIASCYRIDFGYSPKSLE